MAIATHASIESFPGRMLSANPLSLKFKELRQNGMRNFLATLLLAVFAVVNMTASINAKPRSFQQIVDAYFDDYFKANPSQATSVGFHQYDRQLQDFSFSAHQRNRPKLL